jgi:hypothetical protein
MGLKKCDRVVVCRLRVCERRDRTEFELGPGLGLGQRPVSHSHWHKHRTEQQRYTAMVHILGVQLFENNFVKVTRPPISSLIHLLNLSSSML